jgi:hypothetical protein
MKDLSLHRAYEQLGKDGVVVWCIGKLQIHEHKTCTIFIYLHTDV